VVQLCTRAILVDRGAVQFDGRPAEAVAEFRKVRREPIADRTTADKAVAITDVQLLQADGEPSPLFTTGHPMTIRVGYHARQAIRQPHVAIDIHGADGVYCAGINTRMDNCTLGTLDGRGYVDLSIAKLSLLPGCYSISAGILDPQGLRPLDLLERAFPFSVVSDRRDFGFVYLEHQWTHGRGADARPVVRHEAHLAPRPARSLAAVAVQEELG
jgi:hypothetical protein